MDDTRGEPFVDDTPCPRCGQLRLIRRRHTIEGGVGGLRDLRHALTGRPRRTIVRRTYVCELCGHTWHIDERTASEEER